MKTSGRRANNFVTLLESLWEQTDGENVSLRELLNIVGVRSFGPVILLLGFVSITPLTIVPGANWLVALVVLLFSGQLLMLRKTPWLPRRLLETRFPRKYLKAAVDGGVRWARMADKATRPRLAFLTRTPFSIIPAMMAVVAALVTFPLGLIPFGPVLPGVSLILLGVGLTARDGVFLALASLALVGSGWLLWQLASRSGWLG